MNDRKGRWPVGWALSAEIFWLFRLQPRHFGNSFGRSLVAEGTKECRFCAVDELEKCEDSSFAPVKVEDHDQFLEVKLDMTNGDTKYYVSNQGLTTGEKIQQKMQEETAEDWTEDDFDSGYGELQPSSFEVPAPSQLPINCWGNIKPPLTWFSLVALVLQYLPNHCGTLKDIFQKIEDNFPYYSDSKIDKGRNLYDVGTWAREIRRYIEVFCTG